MTAEQKSEITSLMDLGANITKTTEHIKKKFDKFETPKALYNLKQTLLKTGENTAQLLLDQIIRDKEDDSGMVAEVVLDNANKLKFCFIQTSFMKEMFAKYSDHILIDATYCLNFNRMPLYIVLAVDGENFSQIIAICLVARETKSMIEKFITTFKQNNFNHHHIQTIMIDKDLTEVELLKKHFPNASIELCLFHVLKAIKTKLATMNLPKNTNIKIKKYVQQLVFAHSEIKYDQTFSKMMSDPNLDDEFYNYFMANWAPIKHMWCQHYRNTRLNLGDSTNNRLESLNQKIKILLRKNSQLNIFYNDLKLFIKSKEAKTKFQQFNEQTKIRFYRKYNDETIEEALNLYRNLCTNFASEQIEIQLYECFILEVYLLQQIDDERFSIAFDKHREVIASIDSCICSFYNTHRLPCKHIFYIRNHINVNLFDEELVIERWKKNLWLTQTQQPSFCKESTIESSFSTTHDRYDDLVNDMKEIAEMSSQNEISYLNMKNTLKEFKNFILKGKPFHLKAQSETINIQTQYDNEDFEELPKLEKYDTNKSYFTKDLVDIKVKVEPPEIISSKGRPSGSRQTVLGIKRQQPKPSQVRAKKISKLPLNQRFDRNSPIQIKQRFEETKNYRSSFHNKSFEISCSDMIWIKEPFTLTFDDKLILESEARDMNTDIINHYFHSMTIQYPDIFGFFDTNLFSYRSSDLPMNTSPIPEDGLFIQILLVGNNHFITVGCSLQIKHDNSDDTNYIEMNIYDSLNNGTIYNEYVVSQLSAIFKNSKTQIHKFLIKNVQVTPQPNAHDCGWYSIANALFLCNHINPGTIELINQSEQSNNILREHLYRCIINKKFEVFKHRQKRTPEIIYNTQYYELVFCKCRQPNDGSSMLQCIICYEWYHFNCLSTEIEINETSYMCERCVVNKERVQRKSYFAK